MVLTRGSRAQLGSDRDKELKGAYEATNSAGFNAGMVDMMPPADLFSRYPV